MKETVTIPQERISVDGAGLCLLFAVQVLLAKVLTAKEWVGWGRNRRTDGTNGEVLKN